MRTVIGRTVINIRGARGTSPARRTLALKPQGGLLAAASVVAGVREAGVFRNFTVGSRIALRAGTLVFVRTRVATGPPVETRLMGPTVIEIFVTELAAPVGLTEALPGLIAGAVDTSRVWDALVTVQALPAILAPAVSWEFARPVLGATALPANSSVTLGAHPAFHARFVAVLVAGIVAEEVVSGPAELVAAEAIVVVVTGHTDLVLKVGHPRVLLQRLPLAAGVDHARVGSLLNNAVRLNSVVTGIPCLHKQRVGPRPGETERQHDAVAVVAAAGFEVEGVAPDDRRGPRAEAAGAPGRDAGLVLLEAHFEVRVTLVAGALAVPRVAGTSATVPVLQLPVHVLHGQDLQLELTRGAAHLGSQGTEQGEQEAQGAPGPAARPWGPHRCAARRAHWGRRRRCCCRCCCRSRCCCRRCCRRRCPRGRRVPALIYSADWSMHDWKTTPLFKSPFRSGPFQKAESPASFYYSDRFFEALPLLFHLPAFFPSLTLPFFYYYGYAQPFIPFQISCMGRGGEEGGRRKKKKPSLARRPAGCR